MSYDEWHFEQKKWLDENRKRFALIRHYYNKEPYDLPMDEMARLWVDLAWIRETQALEAAAARKQ